MAWTDERGNYSVLATRVLRDGSLAPGVYFAHMEVGGQVLERRLAMIR